MIIGLDNELDGVATLERIYINLPDILTLEGILIELDSQVLAMQMVLLKM